MAVSWAVSSRARAAIPKFAWLRAAVASRATARPPSVMVARTMRRSAAEMCRSTSPRCSSRRMALVTEAGWTIRRTPILPMGIDPLRVKASSRSASYAAKVRP
jgi:hypothetical protein